MSSWFLACFSPQQQTERPLPNNAHAACTTDASSKKQPSTPSTPASSHQHGHQQPTAPLGLEAQSPLPMFSLQSQLVALQQQIKLEQAQYPWNPHASRASLSSETASSKGFRSSLESHVSDPSKLRKPSSRLSIDSRLSDVARIRQCRMSSEMGSQRCGRPSTESRQSEASEYREGHSGGLRSASSRSRNAGNRLAHQTSAPGPKPSKLSIGDGDEGMGGHLGGSSWEKTC